MKKTRQIFSFLLTIGMLITSIPVSAFEKPENAQDILHDGYASTDDKYAIYPIPRSEVYKTGNFTLGTEVTVVSENEIDNYTNQFLDEILTDYGRNKTTSQTVTEGPNQILLGIKDSGGAVDTWADSHLTLADSALFTKTDAYLLSADNGKIVILGKDTNAVYYGLATLQMMFSSFNGSKFLNVQIEDYAGMKMRGFIEGFYGGWNYEGRESLMRFARDVKMNTYIYASKTDSYHKNDELYPADQINQIKELVQVGDETKVKYCWSVHLSYFFNGMPSDTSSQDYQNKFNEKFERLKTKFQQLYDVGVRKFAILNDDFGGGSHSEVVRLLNKLDDEFLVPKGCDNLSYCMQGYNKSWSGNGAELEEMKALNESIDLFWTGDDVNSPITQETVDFVKEKTGHEAVFWLNYPVNEHAKAGIYLGEISHYVRDDVTGLAGAVSNPCAFTEANKVGLFQLGTLFWNNHNYLAQAETIWEESFKYLQPEVYESYLTIARNVANCPGSGRVPAGFPESEYIKDSLDTISEKIKKGTPISNDTNTQTLIDEFAKMQTAVATFKKDCTNEVLKSDLNSWLNSLNDVAAAGEAILKSLTAMEQGNLNEAWTNLGIAGAAMGTWNTYPSLDNNKAQAGSKRLVPFINKALSSAKRQILPLLDPNAEIPPTYFALIHGVDQSDSAEFAKAYDGSDTTFASFQSGTQQAGDNFGVDLGKATPIHSIDILQGSNDSDNDFFHNVILEYSDTGNDDDWTEILKYENDDAPRHIEKTYENDSLTTRFIRLRTQKRGTAAKPDFWTHIREFTINGGETEPEEPSYGLYASDGINGSVTLDGLTYSIADTTVSLPSDGYIGIKMQELSAIDTVLCDAEGAADLDFQYSMNGLIWSDMPDTPNQTAARYVRLYNGTGQTADVSIKTLSVTALAGAVRPYLYSNSPELNTLHEGAVANMFDGKNDTFAWFEPAIKKNFELVVDFGTVAPIYDIAITNENGNPKFYDAEIYLSTDNSNWGSPVITIANSQSEHLTTSGNYMTFSRNDLQGKNARYMKILITKDSPNGVCLKINEIAVNKTVSSSEEPIGKILTNSLTGALDQMIDGDISTAYISSQPSDGTAYIKYPITEKNNLSYVTFLQNSTDLTNAEVKAEFFDGTKAVEKTLDSLDQGIKTFQLAEEYPVLSFTVTWPQGSTPSLYEIITVPNDNITKAASITVTPKTASMETGETKTLEASILPKNTTNNRIVWSSEDSSIATVNAQSGLVTALTAGTVKITAAATDGSNVTDTCTITITGDPVTPDIVLVDSITIKPKDLELNFDDEPYTLKATILPENATNKNLVWSSKDEAIASVDAASGEVTPHKAGTTTITATAADESGVKGTCTITVTDADTDIKAASITVTPDKVNLNAGETKQLTKTIAPEDTTNKNVTWSSSNESVATVTEDGLIKAIAKGTAVITAAAEDGSDVKGTCTVTVTENATPKIIKVSSIAITPKSVSLKKGAASQLRASIAPSNATNKAVLWASNKSSVASVSQSGLVRAISAGTATITVTTRDGSRKSAVCTITVTDDSAKQPEIKDGETYEVENCSYTVTSLSKQTVVFSGSNDSKVIIPDTVTLGTKTYTVTSIEEKAFKNNKKISSVTIGKNIESIGNSAFEGCTKLKNVNIKSTCLTEIGSKVFSKCKLLKTIKISSKKLKRVGKNTFKGIHKKATIKVPSSKLKKYKKLLSKKGQSKSVKINN